VRGKTQTKKQVETKFSTKKKKMENPQSDGEKQKFKLTLEELPGELPTNNTGKVVRQSTNFTQVYSYENINYTVNVFTLCLNQ
jgi:predicted phage-related endonuclease